MFNWKKWKLENLNYISLLYEIFVKWDNSCSKIKISVKEIYIIWFVWLEISHDTIHKMCITSYTDKIKIKQHIRNGKNHIVFLWRATTVSIQLFKKKKITVFI